MNCPVCGCPNLITDTRDIRFAYRGVIASADRINADYCEACLAVILTRDQSDYYDLEVLHAKENVDYDLQIGLVQPREVDCPSCKRQCKLDTRDVEISWDSLEPLQIGPVTGYCCDVCSIVQFDRLEHDRVDNGFSELRKRLAPFDSAVTILLLPEDRES